MLFRSVPILLYDKEKKVVAAVHAGWRGTVQDIALLTLQKMQSAFGSQPQDIVACIGPSISQDSFEVGEEVNQAFVDKGYDMERISRIHPKTLKHHIDLWEANRCQLLNFGIPAEQIEVAQPPVPSLALGSQGPQVWGCMGGARLILTPHLQVQNSPVLKGSG